jgi:hypothetical protein
VSEFKVEKAAFKAAMDKIGTKVRAGMKSSFRGWALAVMAKFKALIPTRFHTHRGLFKSSFAVRFAGRTEQDIEAKFASTHKGARLQEYGGTITPKRRKWLAIPISGSPAVEPTGAARYSTSLYDTAPKWAKLFFKAGRGSSVAYLLGKASSGKNAKIVAWYQLRKSVRINPSLRFREYIKASVVELKSSMAQAVKNG